VGPLSAAGVRAEHAAGARRDGQAATPCPPDSRACAWKLDVSLHVFLKVCKGEPQEVPEVPPALDVLKQLLFDRPGIIGRKGCSRQLLQPASHLPIPQTDSEALGHFPTSRLPAIGAVRECAVNPGSTASGLRSSPRGVEAFGCRTRAPKAPREADGSTILLDRESQNRNPGWEVRRDRKSR
jgi:hypothetical protein